MTTSNQCQFWDCDITIRRAHFLCSTHYPDYLAGIIDQCQSCGQYKDAKYDVCMTCRRKTGSASENHAPFAEQRAEYTNEALLEELRSLRRDLAKEFHLQEFRVFENATLQEMAETRPVTSEAMLSIYGVGSVKMERYGWDFLQVIQQCAGVNAGQRRQWETPPTDATQRDNREFVADKDADRFFVYILLMNNGEYYIGQTREIHERLHEHRNNMSQSTKDRVPKLQWFTTVETRKEAADLEAELQQLNSNPTGRRGINRWVVDFKKLIDELDYEPHQSSARLSVPERPMPHGGVAPPSFRRRS